MVSARINDSLGLGMRWPKTPTGSIPVSRTTTYRRGFSGGFRGSNLDGVNSP